MIITDRDPGDETKYQSPLNGADVLGWNDQQGMQRVRCNTCHDWHTLSDGCPKGARNGYTPAPEPKCHLPASPEARKEMPMARGLLDYFPLALAEIARLSYRATQQHHPDKEMHWDRTKSMDHADCAVRHIVDRGKRDTDGELHTAKGCWRMLAMLQLELEMEQQGLSPTLKEEARKQHNRIQAEMDKLNEQRSYNP
jgi:hypothetical protein